MLAMFQATLVNSARNKILFIHHLYTAESVTHKSYLEILGWSLIKTPQIYLTYGRTVLQNENFHGRYYSKRSFHFYFTPKFTKLVIPEGKLTESKHKELQLQAEGKNGDQELKLDKLSTLPPKKNVLVPPFDSEEIDFIAPQLKPTFNIAAYADKSETLKHFIHLGVEIAKWEKHKDICYHILQMNFEEDVKPYIFFVHSLGIPADKLGRWFTVNPLVFQESLENIQIRINYLKSRRFDKESITSVIKRTPKWINYSVTAIDKELGFLQRKFGLSNAEVREVAISDPKLILHIINKTFYLERQIRTVEGQMGFSMKEQKKLLLEIPRLYRTSKDSLVSRFNVIHNEMGLSHEAILQSPILLTMRSNKLSERSHFLKFIGKNQYDPTKPNYVSAKDFVGGSDAEFCSKISCSIEVLNDFLKTL